MSTLMPLFHRRNCDILYSVDLTAVLNEHRDELAQVKQAITRLEQCTAARERRRCQSQQLPNRAGVVRETNTTNGFVVVLGTA